MHLDTKLSMAYSKLEQIVLVRYASFGTWQDHFQTPNLTCQLQVLNAQYGLLTLLMHLKSLYDNGIICYQEFRSPTYTQINPVQTTQQIVVNAIAFVNLKLCMCNVYKNLGILTLNIVYKSLSNGANDHLIFIYVFQTF